MCRGPSAVVKTACLEIRRLLQVSQKQMFLLRSLVKIQYCAEYCDREVACSVANHHGSNFASCVWSAMSFISPSSGGSPGPA